LKYIKNSNNISIVDILWFPNSTSDIIEIQNDIFKEDMKTNYNSIGIADNSTTDDSFTKYNNDDDFIVKDSNTKTNSVDSEDFCEANFEDAAIEMIEDQISQWPNEIYQVFAKICVDYDLSN